MSPDIASMVASTWETPLYGSNQEQVAQGFHEMVGSCPAMLRVFEMIRKVAVTDFPVLITGASGTGKEMVAQAIHQCSARSRGPFVVVNCGAIPQELLESELFGHERGAFTGAIHSVVGKVELAQGGTLFLDEIGELPLEMQVKLLRFLQDFTFERVGGRQRKEVDVRVISATNANLPEMLVAGRFREDLFYRLESISIELPPLKDRGEDILIAANLFLEDLSKNLDKKFRFTKEALRALSAHEWPGNMRELINRLRRAVVLAEGSWITPENLGLKNLAPAPVVQGKGLREAMAQFEAQLLSESLRKCGGNIQKTAQTLKTSRSVIYHLIKKYKLDFISTVGALIGLFDNLHRNGLLMDLLGMLQCV